LGRQASKSQVYETILEELSSAVNSPALPVPTVAAKNSDASITCQPVFVIDPETETVSRHLCHQ
jgi:hypothetical protein